MRYSQISVTTTREASELIAYFLQEVCDGGVSIYDANDILESSWDYIDESLLNRPNNGVTVKGCCKTEDTNSVLCFLRQSFLPLDKGFVGSLEIDIEEIDGDGWVAFWQQNFKSLDVGQNFVICPQWLDVTPTQAQKKVLKLLSGAAFGTGQHETTSMCLELLEQIDTAGKTVADIGCGSGILGLAALLTGAKTATLADIDLQAAEIAQENAKLNNLQHKCQVVCGNLTEKLNHKYDIVLANLTAEILYMLAKDILGVCKCGTMLILSGILSDRVQKVVDCFTGKGFTLQKQIDKGEWCALILALKTPD